MNISFFLQPKSKVAYIYNSDTLRQGLQKMNHYGYSAIPVLDEDEHYVGTVTEGDFLWHMCRINQNNGMDIDIKELEKESVDELYFRRNYPSVTVDTSMEELFAVADAGRLMPPKSTWFEPKLRSGLFIHSIKEA
mgnify:CR=1 FL=1